MSLDDVVNVQITLGTAVPTLPGFGVPLLLGEHSVFAERRRLYTEASQMLTDGFLSTDQLYLDAVKLMSQALKPTRFMVGRRDAPVALSRIITIGGAGDGAYTISQFDDGSIEDPEDFTFNASGNTDTEIRDGLKALIDASTKAVTTAAVSTNQLQITADEAGIPFSYGLSSPSDVMTDALDTANSGLAEDIQAVTDVDADWYTLLIPERDDQHILYAASVIESYRRVFAAQSSDSDIVDTAPGTPTSDVLARLNDKGYSRTHLWYDLDASSLAAAVNGRCLPETPGSITWAWQQITGISPSALTANQLLNLRGDLQAAGQGKAGNALISVAGLTVTTNGTMVNGEYIDTIRGADKLVARIQILVFGLLVNQPKVTFDNRGIGLIVSKVRQALEESTREGYLARDPAPEIEVVDALELDSGDKQTRALTGSNAITFTATLAGAIHAAEIRGTISA